MIKQIEGLKRYTDCSMPNNEKQRIERAECAAYNQAIEDVLKLLSMHTSVSHSVATEYAEFCVRCDRNEMPILCLEGYLNL